MNSLQNFFELILFTILQIYKVNSSCLYNIAIGQVNTPAHVLSIGQVNTLAHVLSILLVGYINVQLGRLQHGVSHFIGTLNCQVMIFYLTKWLEHV